MKTVRLTKKDKSLGFSVIEIVVALLLLSIISIISIAIYSNIKAKGNLNIAENDGSNLFGEVQATLVDYTTFGSTNGTISLDVNAKIVTITLGTGATSPASFGEKLSNGSTATGITYANSTRWCIDVANSGSHAIFTEKGFQPTSLVCS